MSPHLSRHTLSALAAATLAVCGTQSAFAQSAALIAAAKAEGQLTTIALPHDWCGYGAVIAGFKAKYGLKINELNPDAGSGDEIEAIKANKDKVTYANAGIGAASHLCGMLFMSAIQTDVLTVPYKGTAPALNDIIAGHVDFIFMELASAIKLHEAGRARILAVATTKRIANLPDIPTLIEAGVTGFESGTWNAMAAPPKTPPAIVAKLNKAVNEVLNSPEAQAHFARISLHAAGGTTADAAAFIKRETQVWGEVIKDAHVEAH